MDFVSNEVGNEPLPQCGTEILQFVPGRVFSAAAFSHEVRV